MSSIYGVPNFNTQAVGVNGQPSKSKMFKWIIPIIVILVIVYFFRNMRTTGRRSGDSCRYHSDCKNKYCKCKNNKTLCSRYNKVCA